MGVTFVSVVASILFLESRSPREAKVAGKVGRTILLSPQLYKKMGCMRNVSVRYSALAESFRKLRTQTNLKYHSWIWLVPPPWIHKMLMPWRKHILPTCCARQPNPYACRGKKLSDTVRVRFLDFVKSLHLAKPKHRTHRISWDGPWEGNGRSLPTF